MQVATPQVHDVRHFWRLGLRRKAVSAVEYAADDTQRASQARCLDLLWLQWLQIVLKYDALDIDSWWHGVDSAFVAAIATAAAPIGVAAAASTATARRAMGGGPKCHREFLRLLQITSKLSVAAAASTAAFTTTTALATSC